MKALAIMAGTALFIMLCIAVWSNDAGSVVEVGLLK